MFYLLSRVEVVGEGGVAAKVCRLGFNVSLGSIMQHIRISVQAGPSRLASGLTTCVWRSYTGSLQYQIVYRLLCYLSVIICM